MNSADIAILDAHHLIFDFELQILNPEAPDSSKKRSELN
jgi:hypothetical protein